MSALHARMPRFSIIHILISGLAASLRRTPAGKHASGTTSGATAVEHFSFLTYCVGKSP
jgi:hypothetical protein